MAASVTGHYGDDGLLARIVAGLAAAGVTLDDVTVEQLGPLDEFHVGGRVATRRLLAAAALAPGARVLDVGAGIGGTARLLAADHDVVGVDLTPAFVEVARVLTEATSPSASVEFHVADATSLPFDDAAFDAAVQLHVGMNVADKGALFGEVARVLRPGGTFAVYDIVGEPDAAVELPVPWASDADASHLATAATYERLLLDTGFEVTRSEAARDEALTFFARLDEREGPPPAIGLHLLMGQEAPQRYANMVAAVRAGMIWPHRFVAHRRA